MNFAKGKFANLFLPIFAAVVELADTRDLNLSIGTGNFPYESRQIRWNSPFGTMPSEARFRERVETLRRVPKTVWLWQRQSPDYNVGYDGYGNIE